LTPLRELQISHEGLRRDSRPLGLRPVPGFVNTNGEKCRSRQLPGLYAALVTGERHRAWSSGGMIVAGENQISQENSLLGYRFVHHKSQGMVASSLDFRYDVLL
jgi:hypothetical protein